MISRIKEPSNLQGSSEHQLIVNADDFGRSTEINEAVIRAHTEGILTSASLMVNCSRTENAVALAHKNPSLAIGLHLVLLCGRSSLKPTEIPNLVDYHYRFPDSPLRVGLRYFFRPSLRESLKHEIQAQIQKFQATGLRLDHLNGHLNIHLHPTILKLVLRVAKRCGVTAIRITRDPLLIDLSLASGNWLYRLSHAMVFTGLCLLATPKVRKQGLRFTDRAFGLLEYAKMDENYLVRLLHKLPPGTSEIYSHPSTAPEFKHELDALTSLPVKRVISERRIRLIRYQDL